MLNPTPLPPEPGLEEEFWSPEVVRAWRVWTWDAETLHGRWTAWLSETLTARCDHCEEVPGWQHPCGIYATKDRLDLWVFGHWRCAVLVVGQVELSGLVIEHERGYRAEQARITHLWVDGDAELAEALRDRYPGVVVTVVWLPGH